jgi:hypothetical protein
MGQLVDDLFKAQPDALFMIAGLVLIGIGVVGSIKTYIDPGRYGRMAALGIGVVLLTIGFVLYARQPAQPASNPTGASSSICTFDVGPLAGKTGELPETQLAAVGSACQDSAGDKGIIVAPDTPITTPRGRVGRPMPPIAAPPPAAASASTPSTPSSRLCTFNKGPEAGATHELVRDQLQVVGERCHDLKGNSGLIVAASTPVTP